MAKIGEILIDPECGHKFKKKNAAQTRCPREKCKRKRNSDKVKTCLRKKRLTFNQLFG